MSSQGAPATADLCDALFDKLQVLDPAQIKFFNFGGNIKFGGRITTIRCYENNPLVRSILGEEQGVGRVLVVDGQGSLRRAVMGDNIAELAVKNRWEGVIINGAIRDSAQVGLPILLLLPLLLLSLPQYWFLSSLSLLPLIGDLS